MVVNSDRAAEVPTRNKKTANCWGGMVLGAHGVGTQPRAHNKHYITSALSAAALYSTRTPSNVCRERNTDWVAGDNSCVCHHNKQDHDHKVRDHIRKDRKAPDCKHRARSHSRY